MMRITEKITIQRSAAEVFDFVGNYENDPQWRAGVKELTLTPSPPARVGAQTREVLRLIGRTLLTVGEVTRLEPGSRIDFRSTSGPLPVTGYRLVMSDGEASTLTFHLDVQLRGLYRLFSPVLARTLRERVRTDLQRLKRLLEQAPDRYTRPAQHG